LRYLLLLGLEVLPDLLAGEHTTGALVIPLLNLHPKKITNRVSHGGRSGNMHDDEPTRWGRET
jgi:hypothetical protein